MKYTTFSKSAFAVTAVLASLVASACADSSSPEGDMAPTDPPPESKLPPASTAPTPTKKECPKSCTTDADCANSCPSVAGGVQCCDTKASRCFPSKTATCPVTEPDPVDPPPAY